ncbi:MAG: alpha/beta fold hydrolase, partial [Anaerolineae bacterium]
MIDRDSFVLEGGPAGALLIHGFTGDPSEVRGLADALHARGYTVHAPLLPGHGALPDALQGVTWQQWLAAALHAYDYLDGRCERVYIGGFSMGGALAILAALERPAAAVTLMATPVGMGSWLTSLLPLAATVFPWWYPMMGANLDDPSLRQRLAIVLPDVDLDNPEARKGMVREMRMPTAALDTLFRLLKRARDHAPYLTVPALVMQGQQDRVVPPRDAAVLYGLLGSADKRLLTFERSGHMLVSDVEREAVWDAVAAFLT